MWIDSARVFREDESNLIYSTGCSIYFETISEPFCCLAVHSNLMNFIFVYLTGTVVVIITIRFGMLSNRSKFSLFHY